MVHFVCQLRHRAGIAVMCAKSCPTRTLGIAAWNLAYRPHLELNWTLERNTSKKRGLKTITQLWSFKHLFTKLTSFTWVIPLNPQHYLLPTKWKPINHLTISNLRNFFICAPWDKLRVTWLWINYLSVALLITFLV